MQNSRSFSHASSQPLHSPKIITFLTSIIYNHWSVSPFFVFYITRFICIWYISIFGLASFAQHSVFDIHHVCFEFASLCCYIIFHCKSIPQFINFIVIRHLRLFLVFRYFEWWCYERFYTYIHLSMGYILKTKTAGPWVMNPLNFITYCTMVSQSRCCNLHSY